MIPRAAFAYALATAHWSHTRDCAHTLRGECICHYYEDLHTLRSVLGEDGPAPTLDVSWLEAMRAFAHAVAMALTERKVPDEWDAGHLTPPQMLEATAHLLDRLDDATDAYVVARKADIPPVSRSMQVALRAIGASLRDAA